MFNDLLQMYQDSRKDQMSLICGLISEEWNTPRKGINLLSYVNSSERKKSILKGSNVIGRGCNPRKTVDINSTLKGLNRNLICIKILLNRA